MRRISLLTLFLMLTSFIIVPLAFAKGSPDKITIWGPSLGEPIEITDSDVLKGLDPWNGQFLDQGEELIAEEPQVEQTYNVIFCLRNNKGELHIFYVFQYAPNPAGGQGFIYLPREGEPWHRTNGQTIIRVSGWHYASTEWDTLMRQILENPQVSRTQSQIIGDFRFAGVIITLIGGAVIIWVFRSRQPIHA